MQKILYFGNPNNDMKDDFETYRIKGKRSPAFQVYTIGGKWFLQRFSRLVFPEVDAIIIEMDDLETIEFLIHCFQNSGFPLYIWTDKKLDGDLITNESWNRVFVPAEDDGKLELLYACTVLRMSHTLFFHE